MDDCSWHCEWDGRRGESDIAEKRGGRRRWWFQQGEGKSTENMFVQSNRRRSLNMPVTNLHGIHTSMMYSYQTCCDTWVDRPVWSAIVSGLRTGSLSPAAPLTFCMTLLCNRQRLVAYLTHASDPRHDGVVKEVEFFSSLAKKEVNLVVIPHRVAYWLTLLNVSRPNKDRICQKQKSNISLESHVKAFFKTFSLL